MVEFLCGKPFFPWYRARANPGQTPFIKISVFKIKYK
jgi:hypothetical protein